MPLLFIRHSVLSISIFTTMSFGQCSFEYQGPTIRNKLPLEIRHQGTIDGLKQALKTSLFQPQQFQLSMGPQEDYIETVFTCEGDFHDPHLKDRLEDFQKSLKDLLLTDKSKLILKKVEPWNSVRVTFKIPWDAALRLKQLAQQGNATLRELGVLAVQIQDQNISLTIAGKNNECTQLVFRTAEYSKDVTQSLSVYGKKSPSLNELGPQGPCPTHLETTNKNIADYLQEPPALLNLLSQHATGEKSVGPHCDGARVKINNILSEHGSQHKSFQEAATHSGHGRLEQASSLPVNSLNPNRSSVGQGVLKFPQVPGLSPGFSPGLAPGPSKHALDNLPPPPPYPEGSSYMTNLQKLRLSSTNTSPLLVNLLQHDPNLSSLLASGRHTPTLDPDSLQPPKKKRKLRKPRVKKKDELHLTSCIPNTGGISGPSTEAINVSQHLAPAVTTSSIMNLKSNLAISQHVFKTVPRAVMHNTHVENKSVQIVPLSSIATERVYDECDTANKIINPVTGLLEPRENLSDTSPVKSDGGKQSPCPVVQAVTDNSFQSPIREGNNVVGYPVRPLHPNQSSQRQNSDYSNRHDLSPGLTMFSSSSQFESNVTGDLLHQKHFEEAAKLVMIRKTQLKNDILPLLSIAEQTLYNASKHCGIAERKCDNNTNMDDLRGTKKKNGKRTEVMPQEIDTKSIPFQLLNKPLVQVKHAYWPSSAAPDSYRDSKFYTQSLSLDTQNSSDHGGQSGPQVDLKTYNNDSGVGSCSERSDDTPPEPGDSDYKYGHTNSVECAKPSIIDPMQQVLPNSNIVTVGYSVKETPMDITHYKIVSPFLGSDKLLNSSLDKTKFKVEKLDMCPTSHVHHSNWTFDEHLAKANNVDPIVKRVVHDSSNLNSPKLSTLLSKSVHHEVDVHYNSMQGHTVPLSIQKKKASPRNSPRSFSPHNPSSPRNASSLRGVSSPRTVDPIIDGPSHRTFLELSAQFLSRESQNKSPFSDQGRSLHSEQRKSPYSMSDPHSPFSAGMSNLLGTDVNSVESRVDRNHVGMESVMSQQQQCNNDISFLKSLDAGRHLNILASTKDATFLPLFQKIQLMNKVHSLADGVDNLNRNDNVTHTSRSPGPSVPLPNNHGPNTNVMDVHTDGGAVHNCMLSGLLSNVHTRSNCDKDDSNHRTNSKGSKLHSDELKGATNSNCRRSSPGAASNTSGSLHQSFNSTLPQPKRLTESVQKLLTLPLLDTSLPRANCRSPASSALGTKLTSSTTGIWCTANSQGSSQAPVLTFSRNPNEDSAHIDLDSITPTIPGFGFDPVDFNVDISQYSYMDINNSEHSCMSSPFLENHLVNVSRSNVVSLSPTKLVPVHTGVITSYKAGESFSSLKNGFVTHASESQNGTNVEIPVASELQAGVCNSESNMAVNSALKSRTFSSQVCTTQTGPPISKPLNERYTVQKHFEQPKNLFQQMGLSEMPQVSANVHLVTGKLSPFVPENALSDQIKKTSAYIEESVNAASRYVKHLKLKIEPHNHENSSISETKQFKKYDSVCVTAKLPENGDNSDIPKLKRQTYVLDTKSLLFNTSAINKVLCNSDLDKSSDLSSTNNSSPPTLTSISEEMENNSEHACALVVQTDVFSETCNTPNFVDSSRPDITNTEISFIKSNISKKEENVIYNKSTSLLPKLDVSNPLNQISNSKHIEYSISQIVKTLDTVTDVQLAKAIWMHVASERV